MSGKASLTSVGLVDWRFFRVWLRWPFTIGMDWGGCHQSDVGVRPGKLCEIPFGEGGRKGEEGRQEKHRM